MEVRLREDIELDRTRNELFVALDDKEKALSVMIMRLSEDQEANHNDTRDDRKTHQSSVTRSLEALEQRMCDEQADNQA